MRRITLSYHNGGLTFCPSADQDEEGIWFMAVGIDMESRPKYNPVAPGEKPDRN